MPNNPYAKLLVGVNGGATTSGGVTVPSGATIQFSGESTVAWKQARFEILDYPEGWSAPAGWSTDGNGTIYCFVSGPFLPPAIVLPAAATRWGKWYPRLRVNEQITDDKLVGDGSLFDDATILSMVSPNLGLHDVSAREQFQFTTPTTRIKGWLADFQRTLRLIDSLAGGGGGGPVSVTGNGFVVASGGTVAGASTGNARYAGGKIQTDVAIQWQNVSDSNRKGDLVWAPSTSDKTLTLPNATDTLVGKATTDVFTGKTYSVDATGNVLTSASAAAGDILVHNGTKYVPVAKGSNGTFLGVSGGTVGYYTPSGGSGEANTASNLVSDTSTQVGFAKDKNVLDLRFRGLSVAPYFEFATDTVKHHLTLLGLSSNPSAGQSIRWNAGGTAWEYYTPSGVTVPGANKQVLLSDGASAMQVAHDVYMSTGISPPGIWLGTLAPAAGGVRIGNTGSVFAFTNGAGSADVNFGQVDTSNNIYVGDNVNGASLQLDAKTGQTILLRTGGTSRINITDTAITASKPILVPSDTVSFGATPSTSGTTINTSASGSIYFKPSIDVAVMSWNSGGVTLGSTSNNATILTSGGPVTLRGAGVLGLTAAAADVQFSLPRHGLSTPYSSDGEATVAISAIATITLTSAQYSRSIWKFTGSSVITAAGTVVAIPLPANQDASYKKQIRNSGGAIAFRISNGGATDFTVLAANAGVDVVQTIISTPDGVFASK